MEVYRLTRRKFAGSLSGKGAALKGARWNSQGVEVIYTAQNRSLAMAEVAVHLTLATLPDDYVMVTIHVPDDLRLLNILPADLPQGWNLFPYTAITQKAGDEFVSKREFCALRVPSAVTRGDFNVLINPNHPDFHRISILQVEDFPFDRRIFK